MYEFWYDYVQPKYGQKAKFCYMDTDISLYGLVGLLYTEKQMIFVKTFQKMLKQGLILQVMNEIDHCLKEKMKK